MNFYKNIDHISLTINTLPVHATYGYGGHCSGEVILDHYTAIRHQVLFVSFC